MNLNQKLQFEKDGFLDGVEIISEKEMEVFRESFDRLEKTFPEGKFPGQFDNLHFKHRLDRLGNENVLIFDVISISDSWRIYVFYPTW